MGHWEAHYFPQYGNTERTNHKIAGVVNWETWFVEKETHYGPP